MPHDEAKFGDFSEQIIACPGCAWVGTLYAFIKMHKCPWNDEVEKVAHAPATPAPYASYDEIRRRLKAIIGWLQKNQPDVFKRGLWDVIEVAEAAPTTPTWLLELQDFAKEMEHAPRSTCYDSDERDPDRCQKCYLEQIIREIPGAGQGRKP